MMSVTTSDAAWRKFGEDDPYFGVLSQPRFHKESLTDETLEEFFQSGAQYVDALMRRLSARLEAPQRFRRVLDFGCGVGRLAIPFTNYADSVVGVDISPAMLTEAQNNQQRVGAFNLELLETDQWLREADGQFDLVHTYIVLQHIPPRHGIEITQKLLSQTAPGGFCVLHMTYAKKEARLRTISWVKKNVPFAAGLINLARGRSFWTPAMQMNDYNLNHILQQVQLAGVSELHTEYTNHGGYLGVSLAFRKPSDSGLSTLAA